MGRRRHHQGSLYSAAARASRLVGWWLVVVVLVAFPSSLSSAQKTGFERAITVLNEGRSTLQVSWIHPETREVSPVSDNDERVLPGQDFNVDSFAGHEFQVTEVSPHNDNHKGCHWRRNGTCRSCQFTVSEFAEQMIYVTDELECQRMDTRVKARSQAQALIRGCREHLSRESADGEAEMMKQFQECMVERTAEVLVERHGESLFEQEVRNRLAWQMENHTCAGPHDDAAEHLDSTESVWEDVWMMEDDDDFYVVQVKHDRPASQIHVIEDFVTPEECHAMTTAAAANLQSALVNDGRGGQTQHSHRKARQGAVDAHQMQAALHGNEEDDDDDDDDLIAQVKQRIFAYANSVLPGLNLTHYGQETMNNIVYEGRGLDDVEPDRYFPHCDGDCRGRPHVPGTRVATLVMYCQTAERGGHTNFGKAGVHIRPRAGDALFFSYMDPETRLMDTGFTTHSGCPVYQGQKSIVTQWIRLGVDAQNPYMAYNTLGQKLDEIKEDEMARDRNLTHNSFADEESKLYAATTIAERAVVTSNLGTGGMAMEQSI